MADRPLGAGFQDDRGLSNSQWVGLRNACRRFVKLCQDLQLFTQAIVAIDSSKSKAVNSRNRNFTPGKVDLTWSVPRIAIVASTLTASSRGSIAARPYGSRSASLFLGRRNTGRAARVGSLSAARGRLARAHQASRRPRLSRRLPRCRDGARSGTDGRSERR